MEKNNTKVTRIEQMIFTAARLIKDEEILMVGTQWPIITALLAQKLHAPNSTICLEGGSVMGKTPRRIPLTTADPTINSCCSYMGDALDTLGMILHGGRAHKALLSAASVDRYGNINTTCVGDYDSPKIRFGGSGGACDFTSLAPKTIIIMEHDKQRFPEAVDFITSPGYLKGKDSRTKAGLRPGTGPHALVTTLGLFHFDPLNGEKEMILSAFNPTSSIREIKDNIQWEIKISDKVKPLIAPNKGELKILRQEVDPQGMYLENNKTMEKRNLYY